MSRYLNKFRGRKVFVLVDEFDSIISKAIDTVADVKVLEAIIEIVLKDNSENLAGILITGLSDLHGVGMSTLFVTWLKTHLQKKSNV